MCEEKKILKYCNFWGDVPRMIFRLRGDDPPVPPLSTPMDRSPEIFSTFYTYRWALRGNNLLQMVLVPPIVASDVALV